MRKCIDSLENLFNEIMNIETNVYAILNFIDGFYLYEVEKNIVSELVNIIKERKDEEVIEITIFCKEFEIKYLKEKRLKVEENNEYDYYFERQLYNSTLNILGKNKNVKDVYLIYKNYLDYDEYGQAYVKYKALYDVDKEEEE